MIIGRRGTEAFRDISKADRRITVFQGNAPFPA
jgi:hypothetical protein